MSNQVEFTNEILSMINNQEITPDAGMKMIKKYALVQNTAKEQKPQERHNENSIYKETKEIAVIGMSGIFPGADNIIDFWSNLVNGKDTVTDFTGRWDKETYFSEEFTDWGKTHIMTGGVIDDIYKFDSGYFNITPLEAQLMDPQQRLFLMAAIKAIEDAGYATKDFYGKKCGVFAGVRAGDYESLIKKNPKDINSLCMTGNSTSLLPARISYYLNLTGPSIAIDTACSSSLVAIHQAVESIVNGESQTALAGGISLYTTPELLIMTSKGQMLSATGQCRAFDDSADGFVLSEGLGCVLLKEVSQAIADKDHIYGIIKGWGVNQDGKTNGITSPSVNSQYSLEKEVYSKFSINPSDISYIETHGTGTKLGDPIEFSALSRSFSEYTHKKQYCAIGSVKTNIGHTLAAAGVISLIKVLLCMEHKKLVSSLHYETANSHLNLTSSPFYVNTGYEEWMPINGRRLAAVSSFGLSGTNCHLVVEDYEEDKSVEYSRGEYPLLFPISAKSEQGLRNNITAIQKSLMEYSDSKNLYEISRTLSLGRDHFKFRSAIVAASKEELMNGLKELLEKEICHGNCLSPDSQAESKIFAKLFVAGEEMEFKPLYKEEANRVSIYSDGFEYKESKINQFVSSKSVEEQGQKTFLHKYSIDEEGIRFRTVLRPEDFFLRDHLLEGSLVLPGVVYLELICEAGRAITEVPVSRIENLQWISPIQLNNGQKEIEVEAIPENGKIAYKIWSVDEEGRKSIHCKGYSVHEVGRQEAGDSISLDRIKEFCTRPVKADDIYSLCKKMGIYHGASMRTIKEAYASDGGCFSLLSLTTPNEKEEYTLHPGIMDGILQTVIGIPEVRKDIENQTLVPFSLGELHIYGPLEKNCYVYFTTTDDKNKFNASVINKEGKVLLALKDYEIKSYGKGNKTGLKENYELVYLKEEWIQSPLQSKQNSWEEEQILLLGGDKEFVKAFPIQVNCVEFSNYYEKQDNKNYIINPVLEEDYKKLFEELHKDNKKLTKIIFIQPDMPESYEEGFLAVFGLIRQYFLRKDGGAHFITVIKNSDNDPNAMALYGLLKTAYLENPGLCSKMIAFQAWDNSCKETLLQEVLNSTKENILIKYDRNGDRLIRNITSLKGTMVENVTSREDHISFRHKGHYILTGGTGGLGIIFAKYLIKTYQCKITLIGRANKEDAFNKILNSGLEDKNIAYYRADTTDFGQMEETFRAIRSELGNINGVIQCTGVIRDKYMIHKTQEELLEVIKAKVLSAQVLDEVLKEDAPDFVVYCSAMAAIVGNAGQCDYAYANYFLDEYAKYRNSLVKAGKRIGHTISINWPLWDSEGMSIDKNTEAYLENKLGMVKMPAYVGVTVLENALAQKTSQCIVIYGNRLTIEDYFMQNQLKDAVQVSINNITDSSILEITIQKLKKIFSKVILKPEEAIEADETFEEMGIDSIIIININWELEQIFGAISKTLLFEYNTISALGEFLINTYQDMIVDKFMVTKADTPKKVLGSSMATLTTGKLIKTELASPEQVTFYTKKEGSTQSYEEEIAVIGLSGRFPQADNMEDFWRNLVQGRDCISKVPKERFEIEDYFNEDKEQIGTTYGKWGGFLSEIDLFDPIYFNISPKEAEIMDPQERLFLEEAYKALSDACYTREELKEYKVGVYAGVMYGQYQLLGMKEDGDGRVIGSSYGSIANRVSYFFDFHGPSIALDTMCSSSLTTIHLACESIRRGECDMALAGGVNISVHPNKYLLLSQGKFLSTDGKCRSFGEGGDGYVPGEGAGVVVLKALSKAITDQDNIYGIVKASSINHGGRTNGYSVPNPNLQGELIKDAVKKAGIKTETINYLETHGTGTALGDPIEITGLLKAFPLEDNNKNTISIGSVKSIIGHLEAAAGVAAVTKAFLQMKHKKLVPSLHSETLNHNIDFTQTPFKVQHQYEDWKPISDEQGVTMPRRCGVSSFGAGGSNAFLILEEKEYNVSDKKVKPQIIVLSAGTKAVLKEYIESIKDYVLRHAPGNEIYGQAKTENYLEFSELTLENIAYSLQKGRSSLREKVAFTASSIEELIQKLSHYLLEDYTGIYTASTKPVKLAEDESVLFRSAVLNRDYRTIIDLWLKGAQLLWEEIHLKDNPRRISLPYVPLNRKRYWYNSYKQSNSHLTAMGEASVTCSEVIDLEEKLYSQGSILNKLYEMSKNYSGEEVKLEIIDSQIAVVRMEDYKGRNSFTEEVIAGLMKVFDRINNDLNIKAAIVTGYENVFCMGGTKQQLEDISNNLSRFSDIPFLYKVFLEARVPVIAAMQGHANGGGMLFGLYADFVIMAEESVYSAVFTKYGFTPGMGGTYIIEKKLGENIAAEMMYTARGFSGEELRERGCSVMIRRRSEVLGEALSIARMLSEKPRVTLEALKKELSGRKLAKLDYYIEQEEKMHRKTFNQEEVRDRINHFYMNHNEVDQKAINLSVVTTRVKNPGILLQKEKKTTGTVKWGLDNLAGVQKEADEITSDRVTQNISNEMDTNSIGEQIGRILIGIIHISQEDISETLSFRDMGMDSINGVEIVRDINRIYKINLDAVVLYDYPTIPELAKYIADILPNSDPMDSVQVSINEAVKPKVVGRTDDQKEKVREWEDLLGIEKTVIGIIEEVLHLFEDEIDVNTSFKDMGMDSITSVEIIHLVNRKYHTNLDAVMTYDYPTIRLLAEYLNGILEKPEVLQKPDTIIKPQVQERTISLKNKLILNHKNSLTQSRNREEGCLEKNNESNEEGKEEPEPDYIITNQKKDDRMAIVGISGRYPGADSLEEFWCNLRDGVDSITQIPPDRWDYREYYDKDPKAPSKTYSTVGGFLSEADNFDPLFFHISPKEAKAMDPQQRVFLEVAWSALEDAGYTQEQLSGSRCGVFAGAAQGDYSEKMKGTDLENSGDAFVGLSPAVLASRIAYILNLKGPCISLDTACSSSLIAIHEACKSIKNGECDMAIAGGVRMMFTPQMHIQTSKMSMLSPTNGIRVFDDKADGTILAEGAGAIVIKTYTQAVEDRDFIYAVIRGSGINQDGHTNGITAPSAQSQAELIERVYQSAGINAEDITYVETHGTGTKLGDPIEFKALKEVFEKHTNRKQFCNLGSVKANMGHATLAAGVISVIKVLLSMKHKQIPPLIHFEEENTHINLKDSPFKINTSLIDWETENNKPRLAAVSAFGFSGTNCHLVLEEAGK